MTPNEQLDFWIKGINIHNDERDECCPDFSCCQKKNHWSIEMRELFSKKYREEGEEAILPMLMMALGGLDFEDESIKIHTPGFNQC
jgi:hypothetical protein